MNNRRPVILVYSTQPIYPFWGGSEKFWFETILHPDFIAQFRCTVLLRDSPVTRSRAESLKKAGYDIQWIRQAKRTTLQRITNRLKNTVIPGAARPHDPVIQQIEAVKPDLILFNLSSISHILSSAQIFLAAIRLGIPYWLVFQHIQEHYFARNDEMTSRFAHILDEASRIVCVSRRNRKTIERATGKPLKNVITTVNAIRHDVLRHLAETGTRWPVHTEGTARFINLARIEPDNKGQHILLEVLSDKRWHQRDWTLLFQGGGRFSALLERWITYFGIPPERIEIRDHVDDISMVLANSDLLVLPSLSEGMPFAMIEAMACGRPAVGTPVGGIPELIIEGQTGWLARSTEVSDVADALENAWSSRPEWSAYGTRAMEHAAAHFDQDITIPDLIQTLQEDLDRTSATRQTGSR